MTEPLDHHAALIFAMVTMSAVDRTMTDAELARIGEIVSNLPVFADFDQERLVKTAEACGGVLSDDGGLDRALALIKGGLPKKLRETAYAIALEVAAADMDVKPEETRFLEMLRDTLDLDRLTAAAIERGVRARNLVLLSSTRASNHKCRTVERDVTLCGFCYARASVRGGASVQRRKRNMLSWPRAERKASRLFKDLDIEDLHDQLDSLRAYVHDLSPGAGTQASRGLGRARHFASDAAHDAEEAMKDNLAASLVLALGLGSSSAISFGAAPNSYSDFSVRELDGAGIERAADHARDGDLGLAECCRRNAAGGDGDRARGRAFGHAGLVAHLRLLRVLDGAELILAHRLRFERLGGRDHVFERGRQSPRADVGPRRDKAREAPDRARHRKRASIWRCRRW